MEYNLTTLHCDSGGGLWGGGAGCLCRCPQSRVPGVKGVILPLLVKKVILPFLTTIIFDWGPGGASA